MPSKNFPRFLKRLGDLEKAIIAIQTDMKWTKWIITGAAGLGFIEKLLGMGKH